MEGRYRNLRDLVTMTADHLSGPLVADRQQLRPVSCAEDHRVAPAPVADGNGNPSDGMVGFDQPVDEGLLQKGLVSQDQHKSVGLSRGISDPAFQRRGHPLPVRLVDYAQELCRHRDPIGDRLDMRPQDQNHPLQPRGGGRIDDPLKDGRLSPGQELLRCPHPLGFPGCENDSNDHAL